jgi:tetratricopeptide (TPR) repeat protein
MAAIGLGSAPALVPLAVFAAWGIDRLRSRDKTRAQTVLKPIIRAMEASNPSHESVELALLLLKENRHKINITPQDLADADKRGNFPDTLYKMAFTGAGVPEDDGVEACLRNTLTAAWQALRKDDDIHKIFMQESVGALAIDMKNGFARIETGIESVAKDVKAIKDKEHARDEILQELLNRVGDITRAVTPSEHLSLDALQTLARAFGETTLTQKDALIAFLTQKAADHRHLLAEIDALRGASTRIDNIRGAARAAIEALDYDEALHLLESARTIIREQLQEPIELNARLSERQAAIALIRGDTQTAFSLLSAAADSFAALDPVVSAQKRRAYAKTLYEHGLRYGGSGLAYAIKLWRAACETLTEADHPLDWALTTQDLAVALETQGARTQGPAGTALLAEAVTCYRDALRVFTEADHPLDWAMTTQNLAGALQVQGARIQGPAGTALLADAVTCYRDALRVRTEADHPRDWAMTTQNLGLALEAQGDRTQGPAGTALLADAVTCYRDALRVSTEADHPLEWAGTTQNLANALSIQGERIQGPAGTALLADAVTHLRDALRVFTEADHPLDWAQTTQNLGLALEAQSERTQGPAGTALLAEAVTCYRDALRIFTEADHPLHWAITMENLARAEAALADHAATDDPVPHLRAALTHVTAALTVFDPVHTSYLHEIASRLRDSLRARLADFD